VPSSGALLGITSPIWQQREQQLNRKLDIVHRYVRWDEPFPTQEDRTIANGRIPLLSWRGTKTTSVESGSQDRIIKARAADVKAFGKPVFLEWFWEMNGNRRAANAVSPADYIGAWKRIRQLFAKAGATNAVWVWCPTAKGFEDGTAAAWYPGDASVDWVCADGYNWAPLWPDAPWRTFSEIFTPAYNFAVAHSKPLMVGETGALERGPGDKAAWIDDVHNLLETQFTDVKALVWYDARHTALSTGPDIHYDFRIDTSPSAFKAFKALAHDPFFNPTH